MLYEPARYSPGEIRGLLESYASLVGSDSPEVVVRLVDLRRGLATLAPLTLTVCLLVGIMGYDRVAVGNYLKYSESTIRRQYKIGCRKVADYLNEG